MGQCGCAIREHKSNPNGLGKGDNDTVPNSSSFNKHDKSQNLITSEVVEETKHDDTTIETNTELNDKLIKENGQLNAMLQIELNNKRKQQDKIDELTQKNKQQNDLNKKLTMKENEMIEQLNQKDTEIDKLKSSNDQLKDTNQQLKISNKNLSNCNQSLTNQIEDLKKISQNKSQNKSVPNDENDTKEIMNGMDGGKIGLSNIGNTCWMNSIIQCISHIPKVVEYFRKNEMNGNVSNSVKMIIDNICNNNEKLMYKSLRIFKSTMSTISSAYNTTNEQDPAEFLDSLLSELHNELNTASSEYANNDLIIGNGMPDNMVSLLSWKAYEKSNNSPIIDLFYGQHKSSIICANNKCKYDYVIFEPFKMLAVSTNLSNGKNLLYDCIDQYVSPNIINSKWYCGKCKQDLPNSIEQIQLYKFPKVLIFNLKKLEMQNTSRQPFIKYPVNNLDLTKYDISGTSKKQTYDLFAVSCLSGHHCIAFAKNYTNNQWFCFNDSNVHKVKPNKVVVQNAYLLFYQRKE